MGWEHEGEGRMPTKKGTGTAAKAAAKQKTEAAATVGVKVTGTQEFQEQAEACSG